MLKRIVCIFLVLATLLVPLVGCNKSENQEITTAKKPPEQSGNPLPAGALALVRDGQAQFTIAAGKVGERSTEAYAEQIADRIEAATGVRLSVTKNYNDESDHEIRVGKVSRMDALSVYSSWSTLGKTDYGVALRDGHVYLYGTTDTAIENAVAYFLECMLVLDTAWAAIDGTEFLKTVPEGDVPTVMLADFDGTHATFTLNAGELNEGEMRISLAPDKGWRIQTRTRSDAYNDMGAAQRLAAALDEELPLTTLPLEMTQTDAAVTLTAADGGYAVVNLDTFSVDVYTAGDICAGSITKLYVSRSMSIIEGRMNAGESVYGTGERFNAADQRGQRLHMFTKDMWSKADASYMAIPFMAFSRGSGILLNNYEEMTLDLGNAKKKSEVDTWRAEINDSPIDCYVFATDKMSDAIAAYTNLTGHAEMPEEWTYGMLICRISPDLSQLWSDGLVNTQERGEGRVPVGAYDMIAYMEAYDLPWTGLILEGWGPYNAKKYDALRELCDYVHSLGKKILVYMHVGVANGDMSNFKESYLVSMTLPNGTTTTMLPAADSNNPDASGTADRAYPYLDVTNPEACEWFFEEVWGKIVYDVGVDGCKIDFCEELPEYYELNYYDKNAPTEGSHHWYPTVFCAMFWDMISDKPDGGMCYTRGGGIGSQRAPYMWAGDQTRRYTSLQWQLTAMLSSGLSGVPFMSYDMSGYQYGDNYNGIDVRDPAFEAQVFIRGLQFTAFTPCMQTHGKVRNVFEFAAGDIAGTKLYYCEATKTYTTEAKTTVDGVVVTNEFSKWIPTTTDGFDPQTGNPIGTDYVYEILPGAMNYVVDIYRAYVKLHELLTPYITEYSQIACDTGMPLVRHLALMWQDDAEARACEDEYMFGDAFLVAPVLDETYSRDIYLPEGEWLDLNTGEVKHGGQWLYGYEASLTTLPVFYNIGTSSATAGELLPGIAEIFAAVQSVAP